MVYVKCCLPGTRLGRPLNYAVLLPAQLMKDLGALGSAPHWTLTRSVRETGEWGGGGDGMRECGVPGLSAIEGTFLLSTSTHHPSSMTCHPSSIINDPSSITHDLSSITHDLSSITHDPSSITHDPSSITHHL